MAYSGQFIKITFGFTVDGTEEIADTSINYTTAPGWTGAVAALGEIDTDYNEPLDLYSTMATYIGWANYSVLRTLKVAAIGTDGNYLADAVTFEDDSPHQGTTAQIVPQSTVVLSLRSGFTIGGGNYGRMYLPHTQPALETGLPRMTTAAATAIAGQAVTFVNALTEWVNDQTTAILFPAIMSKVGSGSGKGVTQVGIGRVVDTQRRRRNRLEEDTQLANLA